ncbi:MAG: type II toxin-antitoxin system HicB family antitoxin [Deltaproteobacteria bacterium]|nr:type II toxin-antitoxin system HicB family antitoxin [Deltaproteobacteria bacterium]
MNKQFSVIIERDREGYYVASVPAIKGCHTQATSLDELVVRIREAIELCLEVEGNQMEPLDFIGVQQVSVAY